MRLALYDRRLILIVDDRPVDVHEASEGRFGPDPASVYEEWDAFVEWSGKHLASLSETPRAEQLDTTLLGPPSPTPRQVFAIALNYREHAREGNFDIPTQPGVFTKFASSLSGPYGDIVLPPGKVDWEVELVVVIGRRAHRISAEDAWDHVAGLTVGQDISERIGQHRPPAPQYSLAKSYPGFSPTGPWLCTLNEVQDPNDLVVETRVNGEVMQSSRTSDMIFGVPTLLSYLSDHVTLLPGDLVFTGTPQGVGKGRDPQIFLRPGDVLDSRVDGIGSMRHNLVRGDS